MMCFSDARIVMSGGKPNTHCPDCITLSIPERVRVYEGMVRVVREDRERQPGYVAPDKDAPTRAK